MKMLFVSVFFFMPGLRQVLKIFNPEDTINFIQNINSLLGVNQAVYSPVSDFKFDKKTQYRQKIS
jgi:hypothetical protein